MVHCVQRSAFIPSSHYRLIDSSHDKTHTHDTAEHLKHSDTRPWYWVAPSSPLIAPQADSREIGVSSVRMMLKAVTKNAIHAPAAAHPARRKELSWWCDPFDPFQMPGPGWSAPAASRPRERAAGTERWCSAVYPWCVAMERAGARHPPGRQSLGQPA